MPQINSANINMMRNVSFMNTRFSSAVRRANTKTRSGFIKLQQERYNLTPQDISKMAGKIKISSSMQKTAQDRFFDAFA
jgi:hypothetical protein